MLRLVQTIQPFDDGAARSVFPAIEAWLDADSDRWSAFRKIKGRRNAERYQSVLDFLLCEVCPEYRKPCLAFYYAMGPALRELYAPAELRKLEARLMLFLVISYEAFCQKRRMSWSTAVELVNDVLSRAA